MIIGIGVDIIEIDRIAMAIKKNRRFLERFFTDKEVEYFISRNERFEVAAGIYAAKEAFAKALGTGIRNFSLKDIEILRDELGKPYIKLHNGAQHMAQQIEMQSSHVSISHCKHYAVANVILER